MRKMIIASHSLLAKGFKDTLEFLVGYNDRVLALCAYVDDNGESLPDTIEKLFAGDDEFVVLTDSLGGSVSQQFAPYASDRIHIISGVNLPLAMTIALMLDSAELDIPMLIDEARSQIVYLNECTVEVDSDDE